MFSNDQPLISNALPISIDLEDSGDQLIPTLSLLFKRIANSVNAKESALYTPVESGNFQQYFTPGNPQQFRNVYRKTFDMTSLNGGNIPAGGMIAFPHGITGLKYSTLILASAATTMPQYFSFMYPYVYLDAVNVVVTNPDAITPLTQCYVIAEYLKN